jgi:hypothetical protein
MVKASQGYFGELYLQNNDSFINTAFIKIGTVQEFSLRISAKIKEISTIGFLIKNKNYRNFESSYKTWSLEFKKISIDKDEGEQKLEDAIDDNVKTWIKIIPRYKYTGNAGNLYRWVFVGKGLIVSNDKKNPLSTALNNGLQILGNGPLFRLKEYEDNRIDFETGCVETAEANGCDLSQLGTSIANVDIASIIQPPIQAPNLNLPISSFINIGTQYTVGGPVGWSPITDLGTVGPGQSTYCFWDKTYNDALWSFAGYKYPPIFPTGPAPLSCIVPGSPFYAASHGNKFEPQSIQRSYLVPLPENKYCLIDSGLAKWEYNAWMMLITEFTDHGAPTLGKRYSIDFKIKFYGADRVTVVGEFDMDNYAVHNAQVWYDPDMDGVVPFGARYWRTILTWNNPDLIASNNFYGVYGFFLDYRTFNLGLRFSF